VRAGEKAPFRSPEELAAVLTNLPAAEYRELRKLLWLDYDRRVPELRAEQRDGYQEEDDDEVDDK
jgi:hypothetical protein